MRGTLLFAVVGLCAMGWSQAVQGELITNGGFETGDFSGWTESGPTNPLIRGVDSFLPHSGDWAAFFGDVGASGGISQVLDTNPDTTYQLTFWLTNESGDPTNSYDVLWNGNSFLGGPVVDSPAFGYTEFSFSFTTPSGAAGEDVTLSFAFRQDNSFFDLDDVSVVEANGPEVPEPASVVLWSLAMCGVGWRYRRQREMAI